MAADRWTPEDSPSGADPRLDDDLKAKEKELRKMTQDQGGASADSDDVQDEVEDPESLQAQAFDPGAQES